MRIPHRLTWVIAVIALVSLTAGLIGRSPIYARTVTSSPATALVHQAKPAGPIEIDYWFVFTPDKNGLSTLLSGCFKMTGVLEDQGGAPAWTDKTYLDVPADPAQLSAKCGTWMPAGGGIMEPGADGKLTSAYVSKTIVGKQGSIFISFAGTVDKKYQATGNWFITGGTGAYEGIQGAGTGSCDLSHFPYDRHIEKGKIWWSNAS